MIKKKCTVIVIEDDDEIRESIRDALATEAYNVATFRNGKEAMDGMAQYNTPCLIILDLMMPVMDGFQFLQAKNIWPKTYQATPVFVISAVAEPHKVKNLGASGYVRKPLDLGILLDLVEKHCA